MTSKSFMNEALRIINCIRKVRKRVRKKENKKFTLSFKRHLTFFDARICPGDRKWKVGLDGHF